CSATSRPFNRRTSATDRPACAPRRSMRRATWSTTSCWAARTPCCTSATLPHPARRPRSRSAACWPRRRRSDSPWARAAPTTGSAPPEYRRSGSAARRLCRHVAGTDGVAPQQHGEAAAAALFALDQNPAAQHLDQTAHEMEAQAHAATARPGYLSEHVEDV